MSFNSLKFVTKEQIATITFDRPDAANGLNIEMATELLEAAKLVSQDTSLRAVILTGEGRFFCAGGDVASMYEASERAGAAVRDIAEPLHAAIEVFAALDVPLICAVNGTAAGAGFSMAVAGDMVVASDKAKFTMAYSNIGLSPDGSSSYYLPRLVGLRRTQELMYTNRVLTADEALEWGLINAVLPSEDVMTKANELAKGFAKGARESNKAIKMLLREQENASLSGQLQLESETIGKCADSIDGKEGVASFIEKRKPNFQ